GAPDARDGQGETGVLRSTADELPHAPERRGAQLRQQAPHRDGARHGDGREAAPPGRAQRGHEPARDHRDNRHHPPHARRGRVHHHAGRAQDEPRQGHQRQGGRARLRQEDRRRQIRAGRQRPRGDRGLPRQEGLEGDHRRGGGRAGRPGTRGRAMTSTSAREPLLELRNVTTHYGPIRVLHAVDMVIYPGEMVCLLGGNASGKSTTLKTILGIVSVSEGELFYAGTRANELSTADRIAKGMAVVPENRRIFPKMTVRENLDMGAYLRDDREGMEEDLDYVVGLFTRLGERMAQLGGTMSGG